MKVIVEQIFWKFWAYLYFNNHWQVYGWFTATWMCTFRGGWPPLSWLKMVPLLRPRCLHRQLIYLAVRSWSYLLDFNQAQIVEALFYLLCYFHLSLAWFSFPPQSINGTHWFILVNFGVKWNKIYILFFIRLFSHVSGLECTPERQKVILLLLLETKHDKVLTISIRWCLFF